MLESLTVFETHHVLDVWHDDETKLGEDWHMRINAAMEGARLAILLLTREFLESAFVLQHELPELQRRHKEEGLIIAPILCEPCDWSSNAWLASLQIKPRVQAAPQSLATFAEVEASRVLRQLGIEIAEELSRVALAELPRPGQPPPSDHVYLDKFPLTRGSAEKLIGREQELALLDLAFAQPHTAIVSLVAWGGVGKTMLVQHWLQRLQRESWFGARRVYAWSFYSQGTKEDRQASEDTFLAHALAWFGVQCEPTLSPWDKGRLLADAIARERTLLILDGIEPLQYPPGPMGGQLRVPGVRSLLKQLARKANSAKSEISNLKSDIANDLCLVTTREPLTDLGDYERRPDAAWGSVLRVDLGNLTEEAGAALLCHVGVDHVGKQTIVPEEVADNDELLKATREVDGHALTLNLLGRFLAHAYAGDILYRKEVRFEATDRNERGGKTFKMLAAFEHWFDRGSDFYKQQLAILRVLGLFDRPADAGCIAALRQPPAITGLTDPLFTVRSDAIAGQPPERPLIREDWNTAIASLSRFGLVVTEVGEGGEARELDCHPLIREYFEKKVRTTTNKGWHDAHVRLWKTPCPDPEGPPPESLREMTPLFMAVRHAMLAEHGSDALKIIHEQIQREKDKDRKFYATRILGAGGELLVCYAYAFSENWKRFAISGDSKDQAYVAQEAAFGLRAAGRLDEALGLFRLAGETWNKANDCVGQAHSIANAAECCQVIGDLRCASDLLNESVALAAATGDDFKFMWMLAKRARLFHVQGKWREAMSDFAEAIKVGRRIHAENEYGFFGGVRGSNYCDFLIDVISRPRLSDVCPIWPDRTADRIGKLPAICRSGLEGVGDLSDHLLKDTRARELKLDTGLLFVLQDRLRSLGAKPCDKNDVNDALNQLRSAGDLTFVPVGLLAVARQAAQSKDIPVAIDDLDEAWDIAERGPMRLHMADIHLHRARLFFRENKYPWNRNRDGTSRGPRDDLVAAEKLINECGYHRRDEELADAKKAILGED